MAGVSYEVDDYKRNETVTLNHLTDIVKTITTGQDYSVAEVATEWALASYFGRLNYAYAGKYLFEVLGRYDGSSRFAPGYRWKGFYGASAGYRLSEESFIKNMGVFDNLKLRASYGTTGNQSGISVYDGVTFLSLSSPSGTTPSQPLFGNDGSASMLSTLTESSMVSTTRTWETVTSSNIGLDFAFLNNRLSGTLEYYWKQNDNMLVAISYPAVLGISAPTANNGSFRSEGWEISLNWRDKVGELNYAVGFNIGDNVSNLVSMKNASTVVNGFNSWLEGQPYGTYWGYKAAGLITTQEELNTYKAKAGTTNEVIPSNIRIGDMMFEDADNDGSITKSDMVKLGEDMPHYSFGLNFNLNWKGFDLSAFFQGVGKRTVMRTDQTRGPMLAWYQRQNAAWSGKQYSDIGESEYVMSNNLQAYYNQVQKTSDLMPKLSANDVINKYNYLYSSAWYSQLDGKYIRLKNITFGYTLPKKVTTKASIENARIYFTGTDLFEFTKIKDGWDPEASRDTYGGTNGANAYPFTRGFTVGIDLTF